MQLLKLIRNLMAALAIGSPKFERAKEEVNDKPVEPIESQRIKYAGGGVVESNQHREQRQYTIAGGPGSQRIGDAFNALPPAERQRMIDARKGIIRRERPGDDSSQGEGSPVIRRSGTAAIAHALSERYDRGVGGKLVPKEEYRFDAKKYAEPRVVQSQPQESDLAKAVKEARGSDKPPVDKQGFA